MPQRSDELARSLSHGEVVSTLTGNSVEHIALFFACAKVGAILHPISWRLAPAEVAFQLDDAGSDVFVVEDEQRELAEAALALANVVPVQTLKARAGTPGDEPADDDGLLLIYTSGTTGKPKGALLTHANCFWTNVSFDLATGIGGDDVALAVPAAVPRAAAGTCSRCSRGGRARASSSSGPSTRAAHCDLIQAKRVTTLMGVPANYLFMAQDPASPPPTSRRSAAPSSAARRCRCR